MWLLTSWNAFPAWRSCTSRLPFFCYSVSNFFLPFYYCRFVVLRLGLIIHFQTSAAWKNTQRRCSPGRIECLDHHLKKLRITYYSGKRPHFEFANFLVLNAGLLESLVLDVDPHKSDRWIENQQRQLQPEKRASIGAQIDFTFGDCTSYLHDG